MSSRGRSILIALLAVSVVVNVFLALIAMGAPTDTAGLVKQNEELTQHLKSLREDLNETEAKLRAVRQDLDLTKKQLEYYRSQAEYFSSLLQGRNASFGVTGKSSVGVVAIRRYEDRTGIHLVGVVMRLEVELREGEGRVLVNTIPKIGIDLQTSARTAILVAENVTGAQLQKTDAIITITANEPVNIVDGPSAGVALAVAAIAAIRNETLNKVVLATGTINYDGSVGPVGGILEKGVAAAEKGAEVFLVPRGQGTVLVQVPVEYRRGIFRIIIYETRKVNVQDYLRERGYDVRVMEVGDILEAYSVFKT